MCYRNNVLPRADNSLKSVRQILEKLLIFMCGVLNTSVTVSPTFLF